MGNFEHTMLEIAKGELDEVDSLERMMEWVGTWGQSLLDTSVEMVEWAEIPLDDLPTFCEEGSQTDELGPLGIDCAPVGLDGVWRIWSWSDTHVLVDFVPRYIGDDTQLRLLTNKQWRDEYINGNTPERRGE
jgi:hypothetical protein